MVSAFQRDGFPCAEIEGHGASGLPLCNDSREKYATGRLMLKLYMHAARH